MGRVGAQHVGFPLLLRTLVRLPIGMKTLNETQMEKVFQAAESKGKTSFSESRSRTAVHTASDRKLVSSLFPAWRPDSNEGAVRAQGCFSKV